MGLRLLLGLYVGGISGGLVPAILINIPGTPSSITTTFDGYPMTQKGEPEKALRIGIVSSLFGGLFSAAVLYWFAPSLADWAIKFSYVEKFLIILFALTVIASLCNRLLVGIFSGVLGVWVSLIGVYDVGTGGNGNLRIVPEVLSPYLENGFSLLPVLIGLFGLSVIFKEAEQGCRDEAAGNIKLDSRKRFSWSVFKGQYVNLLRSSSLGTFIGLLPGVGGSAASVLAYSQAKNFSDEPEKFGTGHPPGVIASESSNNGLTGGALIPLLSLGIPGDSTTAVLIGAFTLQGIQVGPLFIGEHPDVWNVMMLGLVMANLLMFVIMYFAIRYIAKVITDPEVPALPRHHDDVRGRRLRDQQRDHVRRLDPVPVRGLRLRRLEVRARGGTVHHRVHPGAVGRGLLREEPGIVRHPDHILHQEPDRRVPLGAHRAVDRLFDLQLAQGKTGGREVGRPLRPGANDVPGAGPRALAQEASMSSSPQTIRMNERDNVAIVANDGGLAAGTVLSGGLVLVDRVPQGHKVALVDIGAGDADSPLWRRHRPCPAGHSGRQLGARAPA